eukprot:8144756-Pyramimonas_sp.AAC.1
MDATKFPESSRRARGLKTRSRAVVVPASSPSPPLQNLRSSSLEPATCPGEFLASFHACPRARRD